MKSGLGTRAFTIVETLIFLAVSAALLISAMTLLNGQQQKTEFSQAVNDVTTQMQTVISNVANGYYNSVQNFSCDVAAPGNPPSLHTPPLPGSNGRGSNKDCIFAGRVVQFAVLGTQQKGYNIYDLVGNRINASGISPQNLTELNPIAIAPPNGADTVQQLQLKYGLSVPVMYYTDGSGSRHTVGAVAFMTSLAQLDSGGTNGALQSGTSNVELHPVKNSSIDEAETELANRGKPDGIKIANLDASNTDGGVTICFKSAGTKQYGVMQLGGNGRQLSANMAIEDTATATGPGGKCT